jgi:hypothetical protein
MTLVFFEGSIAENDYNAAGPVYAAVYAFGGMKRERGF